MIEKLLNDVKKLVREEQIRATDDYGSRHHSLHEAYGVMKEELVEAYECIEKAQELLEEEYFYCAMNDNDKKSIEVAKKIYTVASYLSAEAIQVAAMARKAALGPAVPSGKEEKKDEDNKA